MGRLLGYMANRSDRLAAVLEEERAAVEVPEGFEADAWGIGFFQGGEVLHKKRPRAKGPVDLGEMVGSVQSDCVILHLREATVGAQRAENTHPFRMRQWLFAHSGTVEGFAAIRGRILDALPDFLRRNIRGTTDSEHIFHVMLSFLHDEGVLDHPDADPQIVHHAIRSTVAILDRHAAEVGAPPPTLSCLLTNGRYLYALRRGQPLLYVERSGLPQTPDRGAAATLRYVLLTTAPERAPIGYQELPEGHVLRISRDLQVHIAPLMQR
jgi:predicted glutamine amidotransferase